MSGHTPWREVKHKAAEIRIERELRRATEGAQEVWRRAYVAASSDSLGAINALGHLGEYWRIQALEWLRQRDEATKRSAALREFAERIARMGDPLNAEGTRDRQTVTLNNLIEQAHAALGEGQVEEDVQ